ncbi:MAG: type II toxin-antitoxin system YafQ family toxin [Bacilli bacterium]|nr:type II toxin-antitoxin system YafQ family toxin [Bacilli bacterium]
MIYEIKRTSQFKKDFKKAQKQGKNIDRLINVIELLSKGEKLPQEYSDHALTNYHSNFRECHIEPNFLLVYEIRKQYLILKLIRLGTHSEIFGNKSLANIDKES